MCALAFIVLRLSWTSLDFLQLQCGPKAVFCQSKRVAGSSRRAPNGLLPCGPGLVSGLGRDLLDQGLAGSTRRLARSHLPRQAATDPRRPLELGALLSRRATLRVAAATAVAIKCAPESLNFCSGGSLLPTASIAGKSGIAQRSKKQIEQKGELYAWD